LKIQGTVARFAQVFQTAFVEYKCNTTSSQDKCFATISEVFIPESLKSSILGILGLEQVLSLTPSCVQAETDSSKESRQIIKNAYSNFLGPQVAQVYNFPNSTGAGVNIGIITVGGYFNQTDLNNYFTQYGLGTAPIINVVFVDGGRFDFLDTGRTSLENYLDVEIIASVVPMANITFYVGRNTVQSFYSTINVALQQSRVVSCSWSDYEYNSGAYLDSFQALFAQYSQVPFFAASGDIPYSNSYRVRFPANLPNVIGQ
jgi:kumamolisin